MSLLPDRPAFHFDADPLGERTIRDTSLTAFREIAPSLPAREQAVLDELRLCREAPTSYELFERMRSKGTATDLNSVRPRLTALQERGVLARGPKRICEITGRIAYTWGPNHE